MTPKTDAILPLGAGANPEVQHVAIELAGLARGLELALQRRDALLRKWVERRKHLGGLLQDDLLEDTERELGDSHE